MKRLLFVFFALIFSAHASICSGKECLKAMQTAAQKEDAASVINYGKEACRQGLSKGCLGAAGYMMAYTQFGSAVEAQKLAERACKLGDEKGCEAFKGLLDNDYQANHSSQDIAQAKAACEQKNPLGCLGYASALLSSEDLNAAKLKQAIKSLQFACSNNSYIACAMLGELYGYGVDGLLNQNSARAELYLIKACYEGKIGSACTALGSLYESDESLKPDDKQIFALYKKACELKDAEGCGALGSAYYRGLGVVEDDEAAYPLLKQGCDAKDGYSCYLLADMYENGNFVAQNISKAKKLYALACSLDYEDACEE